VRVAALNDIEGNIHALEAVLAEVEGEGVDAIVCGGDVLPGPFPAEVLDRLTTLPGVRFLRGNVERLVLAGLDDGRRDWGAERDRLEDRHLEEVRSWPLTVELEVHGLGKVLFCHAIPTSDEPIFTRLTPDDSIAELMGEVAADVVVCGHTHVQFDRRLSTGLRVVNAGSVGHPFERPRGAYWALLGPEVELRRTDYDVEAAVAATRRAGAPLDESLLDELLEPPDQEEVIARYEAYRVRTSGA
jgi:diadenosine tetraphosphatase ApaH/serine/threonine PP2A family protein phosphatase